MTYLKVDVPQAFSTNLPSKVLKTQADYTAPDNESEAETDQPTVVNMPLHSYFNLDGNAKSNLEQLIVINADNYTPVDSTYMTTGEIVTVEGTPMDLRQPTPIGQNIDDFEFEQLKNGNGFDHNWVLNTQGDVNQVCATLISPATGIVMDVYTNEPGIQLYSGNFLDGTLAGKRGITYNKRAATCLETQKYPDTPNKPEWPTAQLNPGEKYYSRCIYKFSVDPSVVAQ